MTLQLELFGRPVEQRLESDFHGIKGLGYVRDFLSATDQVRILEDVDSRPWQDDLRRRVQHYGYKYDYKSRSVDPSMFVGPLPPFAQEVSHRLLEQGLVEELPDQMIINEYLPGQGISAHIDCEPCFKNTIVTISLGSACEMDFINVDSGEEQPIRLETGSALILRDQARYQWMHRIKPRKADAGVPRKRRVSLTFRNVILNP